MAPGDFVLPVHLMENEQSDLLLCSLQDDDDLPFEEDVLRNPYSLKAWWRYLEAKSAAPAKVTVLILWSDVSFD